MDKLDKMRIYNTLTKTKEEFVPREDKKVKMFICGPTVYDYIHIGNARTFVFFDVVAKYLRHSGYNLEYIQNITDIDNKIIERAQKENVNSLEYAKKYTKIFKEDMKALGVTSPEYKNATDHIPEVVKQVQTLLDKGNAYVIENDGIYFDLSTFPDYGKLSGRTANMADDAVSRIDDSDKKRNRSDFALWKFSQEGDPSWPASFGDGRPGWHIEDTAITEKYFGPQYDLHGAGQDLIFPHHEAEIAQQESASGLKPFVKYWMHTGFLINKEKKMSKSLGNFLSLNEALKSYSPETIRFYFLSAHYRSPLDFSEEILKQSEAAVMRINEFRHKLNLLTSQVKNIDPKETAEILQKVREAMNDDFNTPEAIGTFFELIRQTNQKLENGQMAMTELTKIIDFFDKVLGIIPKSITFPPEIQTLIDQRELARESMDFTIADQLRSQIESLGYQIDDTIYGPLVKKKK
ncbi:MAG: cysteine--tRNA ligase [bacterium]|nr:cysteine--tRNA ligase [bacterium]